MIIEADAYLEHYGVKGMKWGERKEERAAAKQAKRETKALKFDTKAEVLQTKISDLEAKTPRNFYTRRVRDKKVQELSRQRDQARKDAEAKRQGKLSDNERKVLIGAGIAAAVLAVYGTYNATQSGSLHQKTIEAKAAIKGQKPSWKVNPDLARKDMTPDALLHSVVKGVNPEFGAPGTVNNCRRATFAYEMRRRGFDVRATKTRNARGQDISGLYNATTPGANVTPGKYGMLSKIIRESFGKEFRNAETPFSDVFESGANVGKNRVEPLTLFRALAKEPDGARGEVGVRWQGGGGHSMAWEIVKGSPVVFDAQTGQKYERYIDMQDILKSSVEAGYTRLDNIPLNEKFLLRWLQDG